MARLQGSRDADYAAKRGALVARLRERLGRHDSAHPSFRELAASAGVSEATLRHYFGDLAATVAAVFEDGAEQGQPYLLHLARPSGDFATSMIDAVEFVAQGQRQDTIRALHVIGEAEGIRRGPVGRAYRTHVLDASIDAVSHRLAAHVARAEMRPCDTRAAAIALVAPVIFAFHHQHDLGGTQDDPIDIDQFLTAHLEGFIRGYTANA